MNGSVSDNVILRVYIAILSFPKNWQEQDFRECYLRDSGRRLIGHFLALFLSFSSRNLEADALNPVTGFENQLASNSDSVRVFSNGASRTWFAPRGRVQSGRMHLTRNSKIDFGLILREFRTTSSTMAEDTLRQCCPLRPGANAFCTR